MQHVEVIRLEMIDSLKRQYGKHEIKAYLIELTRLVNMTKDEVFKSHKQQYNGMEINN